MNDLISITNEIKKIDIKLNYGEIFFTTGEVFSATYENMSEENYEIKENGDCLSIQDKRKGNIRLFGKTQDYAPVIRITVPAQHAFENISLATGASEIHADTLITNALSLKMGAGEFHAKELNVSDHATIESGAGEVHVGTGHINNLNSSSGAGEIHIQAALTGDSHITAGVGEIRLQLLGNPDDYSATIAKGIGRLCVNGFTSGNGMTYGSGPNRIKVTGGVGEISIDFTQI